MSQYKKKELAVSIAWIPQEKQMAFSFKVIDIVLMGRHPYLSPLSFEGETDYQIAEDAMRQTQVLEFAHRSFNEISGGEKQRVMIASAISSSCGSRRFMTMLSMNRRRGVPSCNSGRSHDSLSRNVCGYMV